MNYPLELNTMPGFAGSSAYFLRYQDPRNPDALVSKEANEYWREVDLYVGGNEHATGHLIYSRFWNKFLHDIGVAVNDEPFKRMVNQGMIQGRSNFVYRVKSTIGDSPVATQQPTGEAPIVPTFVSANLRTQYDTTPIHVDISLVTNDVLDTARFRAWRPEYANAEFILEDGKYVCGWAVEKMSKSMFNVVNPDDVIDTFGADTLRLYEMFLGPLEQSKPWDTAGIEGLYRFLRRSHRLVFGQPVIDRECTPEEARLLHKTIKKVTSDIEILAMNTAVSQLMIFLNGFAGETKPVPREAAEAYTVMLSPFAPHLGEEMWEGLGHSGGVSDALWPEFDEAKTKDAEVEILIQVSSKPRARMMMPADATPEEMQRIAMNNPVCAGKTFKKIIAVPGRLVNFIE